MTTTTSAAATTNGRVYDLDAHLAMVKPAAQVQAEAAAKAAQDATAEPAPTFAPMTLADLLSMPPKEWLIDQIIGKSDLGMIYGGPGTGKTFVVIDLIMSACLGQQWAMRFDVVRPLNVAYAAGEGISGLPARFAAAAQHYGVDTLGNFTFFKAVPQLYNDNQAADAININKFVREWKARQERGEAKPLDLLVVDTLHTATTAADENSSRDMGTVLTACRWAAHELGCAVILVHHTNKS
ncbi:MAG: AAA family ATPase, partial [Caldilineaceae bacterium]|nr:AAA family ATPase [Caldilineaceae bacterium]